MTLLTTIQTATDWIGVPRPTSVVASTDQQVRQLYAFANEMGDEITRGFPWKALLTEKTFTTTAAAVQVGALATDWLSFIADSMWNRSLDQPIQGPISPQAWQAIQASGTMGPIPGYFRLRGTDFLMTPTPAAGQTIAYEYVSFNWARSNLAVPQSSFLADSDTAVISERLISFGIRWRFKAAKGLDYAEDLASYGRELAIQQSKDKGLQTLGMSWPHRWDRLPGPYIVEGSWP